MIDYDSQSPGNMRATAFVMCVRQLWLPPQPLALDMTNMAIISSEKFRGKL